MMWEGIDKRKFPRVKYRCKLRIAEKGKEEVFDTFTENIGAGGICVTLVKEFDLFKSAKLELSMSEGKVITCDGTIVWVIRRKGPDKEGNEYDIGIEFIDISDEDRQAIVRLVDELSST